jgi:hypothetical protein
MNNFYKSYLNDKSLFEKELLQQFSQSKLNVIDLNENEIIAIKNADLSDNLAIKEDAEYSLDKIYYPENTILLPEKEIKIDVNIFLSLNNEKKFSIFIIRLAY